MNAGHKRLRILLIDAGLPNPEFDAGSRAIIDFIDIIQQAAQADAPEVHFLAMAHSAWGRASDLTQRKVKIHHPEESLLSTAQQSRWLETVSPDIVVISRPGTAGQWLSTVMTQKATGIGPRFFYYGHDIHYQRLAQQLDFDANPTVLRQQRLYRTLEYAIWDSFSTVIYGSKTECEHVNKTFAHKAIYLPLYIAREQPGHCYPPTNLEPHKPCILFVGSAHHAPNRDGLSWLIGEILTSIHTSIVLSVVGDWPEQLRQHMKYQPRNAQHEIRWLGQVEQSSLERAYQSCDFAVAPLRFGAGVKGKVFEAIIRQCPVLTTPIGTQGLEHLDWPELLLSEVSSQALAERIKKLLEMSPRKKFVNQLQSMQDVLAHESMLAPLIWAALI